MWVARPFDGIRTEISKGVQAEVTVELFEIVTGKGHPFQKAKLLPAEREKEPVIG